MDDMNFVSSGMEDFSNSDFVRFPSYKIINQVYAKMPEDLVMKHRGSFVNLETMDIRKEMKVIPLLLTKSSAYNEGKYPNTSLVCYSRDYFSPDANPPVSPTCRRVKNSIRGRIIEPLCPKAAWTSVDGKRTPPQCRDTVILTLKEVGTENVFQLSLKGMNLYGTSPLFGFIDHVKKSGKEMYCFSTTIKTESGDMFFPKVKTAALARIVTFNDVAYLSDWKDNLELVKTIKDQIMTPAPAENDEDKSTLDHLETDSTPY